MLQRDVFTGRPSQWSSFAAFVDQVMSDAIETYQSANGAWTQTEAVAAFNELFRIARSPKRGGGDPNYRDRDIPVAYSYFYAPRQVSVIAHVLQQLSEVVGSDASFDNVVDIGSETDAGALAVHFSGRFGGKQFYSFDSSPRMLSLARAIDIGFVRDHRMMSLEEIAAGDELPQDVDLALLAHTFQYRHIHGSVNFFDNLSLSMSRMLRPGAVCVVMGPSVKSEALQRLRGSLIRSSCFDISDVHEAIPSWLSSGTVLPRLTAKRAQILGDGHGLHDEVRAKLYSNSGGGKVFMSTQFSDPAYIAIRNDIPSPKRSGMNWLRWFQRLWR